MHIVIQKFSIKETEKKKALKHEITLDKSQKHHIKQTNKKWQT